MTAAKTALALFLCALLFGAQAVYAASPLASGGPGKAGCCCQACKKVCHCGCEIGGGNTPSQSAPVTSTTASSQSVFDTLARQIAHWTFVPAEATSVALSVPHSSPRLCSAPLYVRFCAQLI